MVKKKTTSKEEKKETKLENNYQIAYDFATKAYKQFQEVIKSIVLFGSVTKQLDHEKSDIDIILIVDDCTINWDSELIGWYRTELQRLAEKQNYNKKLHISTVTLTTFWEEVKAGDPLIINVIRYGQPLIDFGGFFEPLKVLLAKGRIRPTPEAIFTAMTRAYENTWKGNNSILFSVEMIYWGMVDAAHAALMSEGEVPPSPEHISDFLMHVFVDSKILSKKYPIWFEDIRKLTKEITHGEVKHISGKKIDEIRQQADEFVRELTNIAKNNIRKEKIIKAIKKDF